MAHGFILRDREERKDFASNPKLAYIHFHRSLRLRFPFLIGLFPRFLRSNDKVEVPHDEGKGQAMIFRIVFLRGVRRLRRGGKL